MAFLSITKVASSCQPNHLKISPAYIFMYLKSMYLSDHLFGRHYQPPSSFKPWKKKTPARWSSMVVVSDPCTRWHWSSSEENTVCDLQIQCKCKEAIREVLCAERLLHGVRRLASWTRVFSIDSSPQKHPNLINNEVISCDCVTEVGVVLGSNWWFMCHWWFMEDYFPSSASQFFWPFHTDFM
jgi:hypothetical protein